MSGRDRGSVSDPSAVRLASVGMDRGPILTSPDVPSVGNQVGPTPDVLDERDRRAGRLDLELVSQCGGTPVELAERPGSVPRQQMESHHPPVRALMGSIVRENPFSVEQPFLGKAPALAVGEQLIERGEINGPEPLAFVYAPVPVPPLKQIRTIVIHPATQAL